MAKGEIENENLASILAYFIIGIIWYFSDKNMKRSDLARFHVKQSINLFVISILTTAVVGLFLSIFGRIPVLGWMLGALLHGLLGLIVLVLWVIGIINALNSKKKEIPVVGGFAEKYLKF